MKNKLHNLAFLALGIAAGFVWLQIDLEAKNFKAPPAVVEALPESPTFSETEVKQLEKDLKNLKTTVRTQYSNEGWVLTGDLQNSSFAQFGFKSGDVVRHDRLAELRKNSTTYALARRMESVLKYLEN